MGVHKVDRNAIKFNQVSTSLLVVAAFLANAVWLIGLLALVLATSTAWPQWGAFRLVYRRVVLPLSWLRPNVLVDEPAPHRFAQGVGAAFLSLSWIALGAGAVVIGWTLAWVVAALAAVNVVFDFCAGCFMYYQLRRFGLFRRTAEAE